MADLHTITIDLNDIRERAEAVSRIRLNRATTPEEEMRGAIYNLERAIDECHLAEYALKVEQQKADQMMLDAGYDSEGSMGEDGTYGRQIVVFSQYIDTFTRRIAAINRVLEDRNDAQST